MADVTGRLTPPRWVNWLSALLGFPVAIIALLGAGAACDECGPGDSPAFWEANAQAEIAFAAWLTAVFALVWTLRGARGARAATWISLAGWTAWAVVSALWVVAAA